VAGSPQPSAGLELDAPADDEAFIHGPRMTKLAEAIAAAGIRKRLFAYCRIDSLLRNRQVLAAWKEIGLERVFVGIDAITEKDLDEYRKRSRSRSSRRNSTSPTGTSTSSSVAGPASSVITMWPSAGRNRTGATP
jgi:hypothetical protein